MAVQLITYDLRKPGQDYGELFTAIKAIGDWHCVESVWLVRTELTSRQVRNRLHRHIDNNDLLIVASIARSWATSNLSGECVNWLRSNLAA